MHTTWPTDWEHSELRKPLFNIFYPTGVKSLNPNTNLYHWWQSRAHRKQVPHRQNFRRTGDRPWYSYLYSWKPCVFAWWVAFTFTFGSLIFVAVAAVLLNPKYANDKETALFLGGFALCGAFIFIIGGTCQVLEILQAPLVLTGPHLTRLSVTSSLRPSISTESLSGNLTPVHKELVLGPFVPLPGKNGFDVLCSADINLCERISVVFLEFRRIDLCLSWIQWIGTILFVVNSFGTAGIWSTTDSPEVNYRLFLGVTIVPDIVASCTFVIAGWLQVVEASHCWYGGFHPRNIGWLAGVSNTLGGLGFLANALAWYFVQGGFISALTLLIGSVFFLIGSAIAWIEQSQE